jgi:hypothetical protein
MRERLPNRRDGDVISFDHEGIGYVAQVSRFADGRLAEVFLDAGKPGDALDIMAKDMATLASIALQHGVPVADIRAALSQERDGTMRGPLGVLLAMAEGEA